MPSIGFGPLVAIVVGLYLLRSIKILREYERGVIFRLGRLLPAAKGPGIILVFAPVDRMVRISLRQDALEVPPQDKAGCAALLPREAEHTHPEHS